MWRHLRFELAIAGCPVADHACAFGLNTVLQVIQCHVAEHGSVQRVTDQTLFGEGVVVFSFNIGLCGFETLLQLFYLPWGYTLKVERVGLIFTRDGLVAAGVPPSVRLPVACFGKKLRAHGHRGRCFYDVISDFEFANQVDQVAR